MAKGPPSYFACTLSEALEFNQGKGVRLESTEHGVVTFNDHYEDINSFVDFLAGSHGDNLAVGCAIPSTTKSKEARSSSVTSELLGFRDVQRLSHFAAQYFESSFKSRKLTSEWVALIASSSTVFLITWLGLIRAGFKVLLIAPQSSQQAIQHLLRLSNASIILHDRDHLDVAEAVIAQKSPDHGGLEHAGVPHQCIELPWKSLDDVIAASNMQLSAAYKTTSPRSKPSDITYSFHSSGTTGLPKLIPQTHHGAVGVLPLLQENSQDDSPIPGTFTTTPLYSGGVADIFRSWSRAAPLWLFPEGAMPITAKNVLSCIDKIDLTCQDSDAFPKTRLQYLSCVPFVLEAMMENAQIFDRLRQMEMVGVGGASMPKNLGDRLVAEDVSLVSRFGSSENGFLLSSNREFSQDKEWDVLRYRGDDLLEFTKINQETDRCELIVPSRWPLVCIASHAKRPFNTHDVFIPHADHPNQWLYKGRSDAQLTLKTGKKFDPSEMEALLKTNSHIQDVIIIGDGQAMPGALMFMSEECQQSPKPEQEQAIQQAVLQANQQVSKHARVERQYIRLFSHSETRRIRKNNKGGVVRSSVEADFAGEISELYNDVYEDQSQTVVSLSTKEDVLSAIGRVVREHLQLSDHVQDDGDLFEAGLDSQGCISVCHRIQAMSGLKGLSPGVVYECGTIESLANHVASLLGISTAEDAKEQSQTSRLEDMRRLVDQSIELQPRMLTRITPGSSEQTQSPEVRPADKVFLLTGSTGFLGIHLLKNLLVDSSVSHIFVLIRGSRNTSDEEQRRTAKARLTAALVFHRFDDTFTRQTLESKVTAVPFFLKDDDLGISEVQRDAIVNSITHIIHAAWEVNFNLPLKAFANHVTGSMSLYNLALLASQRRQTRIAFTFCSSIASIQNAPMAELEALKFGPSTNPMHSSDLGYGQSKWVTEQVLHKLSGQSSGVRVALLRVGQLSGDTKNGVWSRREAWPLMIDASLQVVADNGNTGTEQRGSKHCIFPDLASTNSPALDWLPVDEAAEAVLAVTNSTPREEANCIIRPICNPNKTLSWHLAQQFIERWALDENYELTLVPAEKWLDRLEGSQESHRAKALIPLWRANWKSGTTDENQENGENVSRPDDAGRSTVTKTSSDEGHVLDESYVRNVLSWVASQS